MMAARWADIERDIASSRRHFGRSVALFSDLREAKPEQDSYAVTMAFLDAMQSGYASFEAAMKRLLNLLDEPLPAGSEWHEDLLLQLATAEPGSRPALIDEPALRRAAQGLLGFRHVAAHVYDDFDEDRAALAVRDAEIFLDGIGPALARFRAAIDPDQPLTARTTACPSGEAHSAGPAMRPSSQPSLSIKSVVGRPRRPPWRFKACSTSAEGSA